MNAFARMALATLATRGVQAIIVAVIVGIVSFAMMQALPGDAAYRIAAGRYGYDMMDAASADAVRAELGLDQPTLVQLWAWLKTLAQFDLGTSAVYGTSVADEIASQLGYSLLLAAGAVVASLLIALPLGIASGLRPGGLLDSMSLAVSIFVRSIPAFALGIVLVLVFAVQLKLFPVAGFQGFSNLVLPSLTLGLGLAAVSNRVIRDAVVDAMSADWRLFARTKGLSARLTLTRHVLRNAALPVVTYIGVQLAYLIEGVVIVESVFAWPGIGHALVHAIFGRDIAMVQGTALVLGLTYVALNLCVDLACRGIDPRGRTA
ncbi:ABC transporter permease [Ruegeria sp. 2205SS24-7]|uniref:ABC transporter permease n=1 Tax=Ruegeria discodermiae TaxID=3064389 RepID=UPI0027422906|nr:ABC transporter permease [Ruegeria sp. 2205SS24-7]MDP5218950.1 ABC transporter permease [Ruegeria sp. 2205SS24-7]